MNKCFIWRIDNKNRVPNQIFMSDNPTLEEFKKEIEKCLKDEKHSYGFRIDRYKE